MLYPISPNGNTLHNYSMISQPEIGIGTIHQAYKNEQISPLLRFLKSVCVCVCVSIFVSLSV